MQEPQVCGNCKRTSPPEAQRCMWCGYILGAPQQVPVTRRHRPTWMWVGITAVLLLTVAATLTGAFLYPGFAITKSSTEVGVVGIVAASPTVAPQVAATALPKTGFAGLGVTADLPGEGWITTRNTSDGTVSSMRWELVERGLIFAVIRQETFKPANSAQFKLMASMVAEGLYVPPYTMDTSTFHGYIAYRLEGAKAKNEDASYHFIHYVFVKSDKVYMIGAAAKSSVWDSTGEQDVKTILDAVELK